MLHLKQLFAYLPKTPELPKDQQRHQRPVLLKGPQRHWRPELLKDLVDQRP
jgi:hypothetical protein